MDDNSLQLHEFFVEGGNAERSHALLHITEPSTPEEKQKGYFFAVCEIFGSTVEYIAELQQAIDVIEKGYYEDTEHTNAEALEMVLDQVNKQSAAIVRRGIELHWMVGIIADHDIIFSFHGRPLIMLFYKNKEGIYNYLDLVAQNPSERTNHPTVFSQIIQGKISPNDYLVVTTPHVREFYDNDRLQRIITTRSAEESCRHFERSFHDSKRELSFAGVIVTVGRSIERRPAPAPRIPQMARGSSESLEKLFHTEKNTARTLAASFGKSMQSGLERLTKRDKKEAGPVSSVFARARDEKEEDEFEMMRPAEARSRFANRFDRDEKKDVILRLIRLFITSSITAGKWLFKALIIIITGLTSILRFGGLLMVALINYRGRRQVLVDQWKRQLRTFRDHLLRLPLLTKIFFVVTILLVIGVIISVTYLNRQHAIAAAAKEFRDTVQTIHKKRDSAEGDLAYQNEAGARQKLAEAESLFNKLPCQSTKNLEQQKTCSELKKILQDLTTQLHKVVTVQPELAVTWEGLTTPFSGLVKLGSLLLAYTKETSSLVSHNLLTHEQGAIALPTSTTFTLSAATPEQDRAFFLTPSNELYSFDPKNKNLKKISLTLGRQNSTIAAMLVYNHRLYTLDTGNAQIYRHEGIAAGFARGVEWIKSGGENIRDAISFAIDKDLYALKKNGTVAKYTTGDAQAFGIPNLDPALTAPQTLYTYNDYTYLYILDPHEGRIVVLKKDGGLKAQLIAPELKGAGSFVIEEGNKAGYFLNGNKVYKITLEV